MKSYTDKNQDKSMRSADSCSKPQQSDGATFQLVDNRDATIAQRKMAEAINSSPKQVTQRKQLNTLFGHAAQLQSMDEHELQMKTDSAVLQRTGPEEEELLQGQFETAQRQGDLEDEELLQGKFKTAQRQENLEEEELVQGKFSASPIQREQDHTPNNTGLPDNLKAGIENLSGYSMDDVSVHYNSPKPTQVQAHAYAQGTDIHLASGQENHLPHEAWHVVQQKQGRVKPTLQMRTGISVNDDPQLEKEADLMGAKAVAQPVSNTSKAGPIDNTCQKRRDIRQGIGVGDSLLQTKEQHARQRMINDTQQQVLQLATTDKDLFAFGNTSKPKDLRSGDISQDSDGNVAAQAVDISKGLPNGKSVSSDYTKGILNGHVWKSVSGTSLGANTDVVADGTDVGGTHYETHHTIYPTADMKFSELNNKYQGMGWTRIGKLKPDGKWVAYEG